MAPLVRYDTNLITAAHIMREGTWKKERSKRSCMEVHWVSKERKCPSDDENQKSACEQQNPAILSVHIARYLPGSQSTLQRWGKYPLILMWGDWATEWKSDLAKAIEPVSGRTGTGTNLRFPVQCLTHKTREVEIEIKSREAPTLHLIWCKSLKHLAPTLGKIIL